MLVQFLQEQQLIFYILAVEIFLLCLLQLRTNRLLRKGLKTRAQKKESFKQLKEEIKTGQSEIPVVKFEKQKKKQEEPKGAEGKQPQQPGGFDPKEMAVLQDMLAEYFG